VDPTVTEAVRGGGVTELDERGLMPLAEARAVVRGVTAFVKGEMEHLGGKFVLASDQIWAALLSLEDGDELVAAAIKLDWQFQPRGMDNVDLHRRYGDAIVPWIATRIDAGGVLHNHPWCVMPCLLACGDAAAFELAWRVRAVGTQPSAFAPRWIDLHPDVAAGELVARASGDDARAATHLAARSLRARRGVAGLPPLAILDAAAARLLGPATLWPALPGDGGPLGGHRLRAIAARWGHAWGLAIERVEGGAPGGMYGARVSVFAYGSRVKGTLPGVSVSMRPLAVPAATAPWADPALVLPALGLPPDATIVAVVEDLAHVAPTIVDPVAEPDDESHRLPSASAVYRALATALG